jgi:hypothetical protein
MTDEEPGRKNRFNCRDHKRSFKHYETINNNEGKCALSNSQNRNSRIT